MSRLGFALSVLVILCVAAWAYNVNYRTGEALARVEALRGEIARTREDVQVLRVEWAWLNAPDRLARLVTEHGEVLALGPMAPERFGDAAQVPFPPPEDHDPLESALLAALSGAEQSILAQSPLEDGGAAPPAEPDPRLLPLLDAAPTRRLVPVLARPGAEPGVPADGPWQALAPGAGPDASLGATAAVTPEFLPAPTGTIAAIGPVHEAASRQDPTATASQDASDPAASLAAAIDAAVASVVGEATAGAAAAEAGGAILGAPTPAPGPAMTRGLARVVEAGGGAVLPAEPSTRGSDPSAAFLRQMAVAAGRRAAEQDGERPEGEAVE
ncbi:MAG: hypothetical protein AAF371_10310 [Pseudomonadota bacterium]